MSNVIIYVNEKWPNLATTRSLICIIIFISNTMFTKFWHVCMSHASLVVFLVTTAGYASSLTTPVWVSVVYNGYVFTLIYPLSFDTGIERIISLSELDGLIYLSTCTCYNLSTIDGDIILSATVAFVVPALFSNTCIHKHN